MSTNSVQTLFVQKMSKIFKHRLKKDKASVSVQTLFKKELSPILYKHRLNRK